MKAYRFHELQIWKKLMMLVKDLYQLTKKISSTEKFELISQLQRTTISIPSNVVEGSGRKNPNEIYKLLGITNSSSYKLETQLILLVD